MDDGLGEGIAFEIVEAPVVVVIAYDQDHFLYSPDSSTEGAIPAENFLYDADLSKVFFEKTVIKKEISLAKGEGKGNRFENYIVAGAPLRTELGQNGAVFTYQTLGVLKETTQKTTRLIFLAAGIAIVLTTIFAFFLSSRITAPLRKIKRQLLKCQKESLIRRFLFPAMTKLGN